MKICTEHQKIIDAVIEKSKSLPEGALALIGVYGSVLTGDVHEKSDLDLLILINDERARSLSSCFILDESGIAYDIYCTTWENLEYDSAYTHPYLCKLLDSEIIYVADPSSLQKLELLREKTKQNMHSDIKYQSAETSLNEAKKCFAYIMLDDENLNLYRNSYNSIYHLINTVMLMNGRYFKYGTKRIMEELSECIVPDNFIELINKAITEKNSADIKSAIKALIINTDKLLGSLYIREKEEPAKENLSGAYEEMFSNWRNKMIKAAENDDILSSFLNLGSLNEMLLDIENDVNVEVYSPMKKFSAENLKQNAEEFDTSIKAFLVNYEKAGITPLIYKNADKFTECYLK